MRKVLGSDVLSLIVIGIFCGVLATIFVYQDYSSYRVFITPLIAAVAGAFVGGNTVGAEAWREALTGIGQLFVELASTSGKLLVGGVLIFPAIACALLFGFAAALLVHTLFSKVETK